MFRRRRPASNLHKPFSPFGSAPSPDLRAALRNVHCAPRISVGGTCTLPSPGIRALTMSEPLAFPLTKSQARQLLKPATLCKPATGAGVNFNSMHGRWHVNQSFLKFSNPQWKKSLASHVRGICSHLGLPSHLVTASWYAFVIDSPASSFEAQVTPNTDNVFGTLSIQLPSSYRGGEHKVTHGAHSNQYLRGAIDGSCEFKYFYTAFFNDVTHEISPITNGFRTSLVYHLRWHGGDKLPTASSRVRDSIAAALENHAKRFHLGAWTLTRSLRGRYDTADLQNNGTGVLSGADLREFVAIEEAAAQLGFGELDAAICSLRRTEYEQSRLYSEDEDGDSSCQTAFISFDNVYGNSDDWLRTQLQDLDWESAGLSLGTFCTEIKVEGEMEVSGGLVILFWPKQKALESRALNANHVDDVIDESSRDALIASIDVLLSCKEALGFKERMAWGHIKRLTEVATRHKLVPQINRALNFAAMLPSIPDAKTVLCEVISAVDWQTVGHVIEKMFCLPKEAGNHDDGARIRLLEELLSRDLISTESAVRALDTLVDGLNSRKTLRATNYPDEDIDRWPGKPMGQSYYWYDSTRWWYHNLVESWSTLLRSFPRLHSRCVGNLAEEKHLDRILERLMDTIKQLGETDLNIVSEAFETSRNIEESTFIGPRVDLAISIRRNDLLADRFVRETDVFLSRLGHFRERVRYPEFKWSEYLHLLDQALSSHSTNEAVLKKYAQFLGALPEFTSTGEHNALVTAAIRVSNETSNKSRVFVEVKQAAINARLSHVEESLRARVKSLQDSTREVPPNVSVRYPGPFDTGFPKIEEFMASDRTELNYRMAMANPARAQQVLWDIRARLPTGITAGSRTQGKFLLIFLRKPCEMERRRWLEYQQDLKRLEKAKRDHAVALARLNEDTYSERLQRSDKRTVSCPHKAVRIS